MSSMIIPIAPSGAGSGGGGNYILIFADLPQYIAGKYIKVELSGTEIYAATVPNDMQSATVSITEAGVYSIKVYASSSASTPTETYSLNVESLTVNYGFKIGRSVNFKEDLPAITYYQAANSGSIYSSSSYTQSGLTMSTSLQQITNLSGSFTPTYSGIVRLKFSGSYTATKQSSVTVTQYAYVAVLVSESSSEEISDSNKTTYQSDVIDSAAHTLTISLDLNVIAGTTYYISVGYYYKNSGGNPSISFSNMRYYVYASTQTFAAVTNVGTYAKAVKSIQSGVAKPSTSVETAITISSVNPTKSLALYSLSTTAIQNRGLTIARFLDPAHFIAYVSGNTIWTVIEFY